MKKIILTALSICLLSQAWCDCSSSGLYFWPNNKTIRQNSIFIVEGYFFSQDIIDSLGTKHKIYLKCGNEKIELKVVEILTGQFSLTQAILKPIRQPLAGKEYTLAIDDLEYPRLLTRYDPDKEIFTNVRWKIESGIDTIAPTWNKSPVYKNDTWIEYGCGPEVAANFSIDVTDESEYLVGAKVTDIKNNTTTIYYLQVDKDNLLSIGHGMCSGAFYLEKGTNFTVEFSLLDASGNEVPWTGSPLKFKCPESKWQIK